MPLRSACVGAPLLSSTRPVFTAIFVAAFACFASVHSLHLNPHLIEEPPLIAQDGTGQDLGPAVMLAIGRLRDCSGDFTSWTNMLERNNWGSSAAVSMTALVEVSCSLQLVNAQMTNVDGRISSTDQSVWMQGPLKNQQLTISGIHPLDCMMRSQDASSSLSDVPYLFLLRSTGGKQGTLHLL